MREGTRKKIKLLSLFFIALSFLGCTSKGDFSDRSIGSKIDDRFLERLIKREISQKKDAFSGSNVAVAVFNGHVLLTGQVPNRDVAELAESIAISFSKVEKANVSNHLKVMGPISLLSRSNDRWLAAKVRTRMFSSDKARAPSLRVTCQNGTIFLMGKVTSEEAEVVTELISGVFGVEKIVKVFTYL